MMTSDERGYKYEGPDRWLNKGTAWDSMLPRIEIDLALISLMRRLTFEKVERRNIQILVVTSRKRVEGQTGRLRG